MIVASHITIATFTNQHEDIHCIPEDYTHFLSRSDSQQRVSQISSCPLLELKATPTEEFPDTVTTDEKIQGTVVINIGQNMDYCL